MVDFAIGAAISGLKTAGDIAGSFLKLRDEALIQAKVIELQSVILTAQGSAMAAQGQQTALLEEKGRLEKHVADLEAWETEKQRYEMTNLGRGRFAYALKPAVHGSEPAHLICANCYEQGKKSVLQEKYHQVGRRTSQECPRCKTSLDATWNGYGE